SIGRRVAARRRGLRRRSLACGPAAEDSIDECGRGGTWTPTDTKHRDLHVLAAELQRLVTAPHVEIEQATLYFRTGIHHGVHTVVAVVADRDIQDSTDGKNRWIRGGDTAAHANARRGRRAFAVSGRTAG